MEKRHPKNPRLVTAPCVSAYTCSPEETADRIKIMIREMSQIEPASALLPSVMEAVRAKSIRPSSGSVDGLDRLDPLRLALCVWYLRWRSRLYGLPNK